MSDWKISRMRDRCARCEKPFEDGQDAYSVVELDDEEVPQRHDTCAACFRSGERPAIYWKATWRLPTLVLIRNRDLQAE